MSNEKICKYCKKTIDKSAKVCPHCHCKQKFPKWVIILIVIVVIFVLGGIFGSDEPTSSDKKGSSQQERKKNFTQSEIVTYKDIDYTIVKVEKTQGTNMFLKPHDGYEYVKVTLRIENNSTRKISYNALNWQMINSDGVEDAWGTITAEDDVTLSSGDLDAGGKVEGVLIWEQKINDDNLRLRYYDSIISSDYTFQFKLD